MCVDMRFKVEEGIVGQVPGMNNSANRDCEFDKDRKRLAENMSKENVEECKEEKSATEKPKTTVMNSEDENDNIQTDMES